MCLSQCNMQSPACGNCARRNELCEYPTFSDPPSGESSASPTQHQWLNEVSGFPVCGDDSTPVPLQYADWPIIHAGPLSGTIESRTSSPDTIRPLVSLLLRYSWFTEQEQAMWVPALSREASKYPYLQRCISALACLGQDTKHPYLSKPPVNAYRHQVSASSLFRQSPPVIDEGNWVAVRSFSVLMLVFQFYTQKTCRPEQFDIIETLQVMRSTMFLESASKCWLHKSPYWPLIMERTNITASEPDEGLKAALKHLGDVISESIGDEYDNPDDEQRAEINNHAFCELREWAAQCAAHPRRWYHYCQWPGRVMPEFFDVLAGGDDIALLILAHWATIMHLSPKPIVQSWARRTAFYAIRKLRGGWSDVLVWPLALLSAQPEVPFHRGEPVPTDLQFPSYAGGIDPQLCASTPVGVHHDIVPGPMEGLGVGWVPYVHTTLA